MVGGKEAEGTGLCQRVASGEWRWGTLLAPCLQQWLDKDTVMTAHTGLYAYMVPMSVSWY